jgi:hypothetical protein
VSTPTDEQILRLPQWAQAYIRVLAMRAAEAELRLRHRTLQTPTHVLVESGGRVKEYLPDSSVVTFWPSDRSSRGVIEVSIHDMRPGFIQVRTPGIDALMVTPVVTNVVTIGTVQR